MKVIDSHIHFWDLANQINSWVARAAIKQPFLNKNYLPETIPQKCDHELYGVVHIEAHDSIAPTIKEIKWLASIMNDNPLKYRHIAYADLTSDNHSFRELIDQLKQYKNVIGIRHILSYHPNFSYSFCDKDLSAHPNIQSNLAYLAKNQLIFDCQMYPYQLKTILPVIIKSNVITIIDHFALPIWQQTNDKEHHLWQQIIAQLAVIDNIFIKASGIDMFRQQNEFDLVTSFCFENCPIRRLIYGSNYPVSFNDSYNAWYNYLAGLNLSDNEQEQLFFSNAFQLFFAK